MSSLEQNSSQRQRTIQILLAVIAFFGAMTMYRLFNAPPKYQPKYQTIAHRFLDLEGKYVSVPDESYELLDEVITEAKSSTHYDATITDPDKREQQLLDIFTTIDSILIRKNFIFPPGEWTSTLGEALEDHPLSSSALEAALAKPHNARRVYQMKNHANESFHLMACEPGAFLYMGVADAIGFELHPVILPKHIFVRAPLDKDHWVNWDPNRGRSISDEDYVRGWGVADWQISQKIYMNTLSAKETDSEMYANIGVRLANHRGFGGYGPAIECYRKAIALNPRNIDAIRNLALSLLFQENPDYGVRTEALSLAQRAVDLAPEDEHSHLALAYAFAANRYTGAAVAEINRTIQLDPQNQEARGILPLIESGHTMYGAFKAQQPIWFWIENEYGWLYIPIVLAALILGAVIWWIRCQIARNHLPMQPTIPALAAMGQ
jgi:tetratricopeptide (TPR) repeat protein